MDPKVRSLLYDQPRLYELVFPDETIATLCCAAFGRYLSASPTSVLDVGCGAGRLLEALSETISECWGVDYLASNVAYARTTRPKLVIHRGDMRTIRLERTFDVVTCFGNALSYGLTDSDRGLTIETFGVHAHAGTLLMVDVLNAKCYLDGEGFRERIEGCVDTADFKATSVSVHSLDRAARLLRRTRVWHIPGQPDVEDYAEYRLLYPEELRQLLESGGFAVADMYDNREFKVSDLAGTITSAPDCAGMRGRKLYAFARKNR
jgi:SAM-dependent methyltransferase